MSFIAARARSTYPISCKNRMWGKLSSYCEIAEIDFDAKKLGIFLGRSFHSQSGGLSPPESLEPVVYTRVELPPGVSCERAGRSDSQQYLSTVPCSHSALFSLYLAASLFIFPAVQFVISTQSCFQIDKYDGSTSGAPSY